VTQRLPPPPEPNAPVPTDDGTSAPRAKIADEATLKVNPAVAGAPTVRGPGAQIAPLRHEVRNLRLATETAGRVLGIGGVAQLDTADPIIGRIVVETIVVISKLGAGGMGSVYLAIDTQEGLHDRKYALKVMKPTVSTDERERFKREVSAAARIRSKRVAEVYRHGVFDDFRPWMLMEYVEGESLEALLERQGPLDIHQALSRVGLALVRAVSEIHAMKVIHRDLKPPNVMIEKGESFEIKLLDFGIARIGGGDDAVFRTNPNLGAGTAGYWSPESVAGQAVEYRTDVWGIGVVLFELLTGELPFGRPTTNAQLQTSIAAMMSQAVPSINDFRRAKKLEPVSPTVQLLVADCLHKDVRERPSMTIVHTRLKAAVEEQARRSGVASPLLTMRSAANLVDIPIDGQTHARTEEAAAVKALMRQFSPLSSTAPATPAAQRQGGGAAPTRSRRRRIASWLGVVAVGLLIGIAAIQLFVRTIGDPRMAAPSTPTAPTAITEERQKQPTSSSTSPLEASTSVPVGSIRIATTPVGASIRIDARFIGKTPLVVSGKPDSKLRIHIERAGFASRDEFVVPTIEGGDARFSLDSLSSPRDAKLRRPGGQEPRKTSNTSSGRGDSSAPSPDGLFEKFDEKDP
jgi:serine/threonine protein kinase